MKKIFLLIVSLLLIPVLVNADQVMTGKKTSLEECKTEAAKDPENYYCAILTCNENYRFDYEILDPKVCSNGNSNPFYEIGTGKASDIEACLATDPTSYRVVEVEYDCNKTFSTITNTEKSPKTGIEDYFLVFGITLVLIIGVYSLINKKSSFKQM